MTVAIVFAYHNVGYRCLKVLLDRGIEVKLAISHQDNPQEKLWFRSVDKYCQCHAIPCVKPFVLDDELYERMAEIRPDLIFSFYYRNMIPMRFLNLARVGSFNMHGSLLPKYRGRVPVNWAIIRGERQCGATLHEMTEKPDRGAIIDQQPFPILFEDYIDEVFEKLVWAAEIVLDRSIASILKGSYVATEQDDSQASYFSGRKPEDGLIDATKLKVIQTYNLVRAVSHPFPGAFVYLSSGEKLTIWRSRPVDFNIKFHGKVNKIKSGTLFIFRACLILFCSDGFLEITSAELRNQRFSSIDFLERFGMGHIEHLL